MKKLKSLRKARFVALPLLFAAMLLFSSCVAVLPEKEISTNTMYLASGASMGETQWTKEYEYGETLGKVVKETTYYNGELSSTTTYEHDEYGNRKSQYRRNGYGELSRHADYIYEEIEVEPKREQ